MTKSNHKSGNRLRKRQVGAERYLKVSKAYYEYRTKEQSAYSACRTVPWIQLKGHWLRQAGFEVDTPIKVRVMEGCLVITL